jgi:eukaryotic-like serine/threonine-protein kinase
VFLVLELLEGQSLAKRLHERGPLPMAEVAHAALAVLDVLARAHDRGVVHRDVKPANIFLTTAGQIKLLDFGVARVAELASSSIVTQTGSTVGTPAFMAPEQAAGRSDRVDALTDIWAVGATMFQLLTRTLVHDISSCNGAIVAAATKPARRVRAVAPDISPELAAVVDRALAFEPGARWPNARSMQRALVGACPDLRAASSTQLSGPDTEPEVPPSPVEVSVTTLRDRGRRALAVLAVAPLLLGAWWVWGRPGAVARAVSPSASRPTSDVARPAPQRDLPQASVAVEASPRREPSVRPQAGPSVVRRPLVASPSSGAAVAVQHTPTPSVDTLLDRRK